MPTAMRPYPDDGEPGAFTDTAAVPRVLHERSNPVVHDKSDPQSAILKNQVIISVVHEVHRERHRSPVLHDCCHGVGSLTYDVLHLMDLCES